ncbi:MAG: cell wall hydrolase [Novosphingobium sp.]
MTELISPDSEPKARDFHARLRRRTSGAGARHRHRHHRGRRALALLAAVAVPAFAAPSNWSAFAIGNAGRAEVAVEPMPFERAGDSFPGSAFYYLAADPVVLDPAARSDADDNSGTFGPYAGPAARALRAEGTAIDRMRALTCLTQAIYYEAASEPDGGQRAVAQVVLNRVAHPAFPNTVCGVVYQGSERSTGCQFSFTCDGALARVPARMFWLRAESVARAALAGYVYAPVGLATHYHTIAVHPYWSDKLNYLLTIGAHRFYRLGGPAGDSQAFRAFAYSGGEPLAAPRPHVAGPAEPDPALDPVAIERAYAAGFSVAQSGVVAAKAGASVQGAPAPHYAASIEARGGESLYRADKLPAGNDVRPEYQNSGKWLDRPGD